MDLNTVIKALPDKPLLRVDEVAQILDVTKRTIYNLYNAGDIEGVNTSSRGIRIFKESVIKYLKKKAS